MSHSSFPALPDLDEPRSHPTPPASSFFHPESIAYATAASSDNKENRFPALPDELTRRSLTPHKPTPLSRKSARHTPAALPPTSSTAAASLPPLFRLERLSVDVSVPSAAHVTLDPCVQDRLLIGRDASSADVHLDSSRQPNMISRRHAILQWAAAGSGCGSDCAGGWRLIDLRSVNGVYVNDVKANEALLKDGDVLCFGGGAGVKTGSTRQQPNSEFRYLFRTQERSELPSHLPLPAIDHSSLPTPDHDTSLIDPADWRTQQRSISLPFAVQHRTVSLGLPQHPAAAPQLTSPLTSPLGSPQRKRRRTDADSDENNSTAEADKRRVEALEEEKRQMHEQYLMALADMEKREQDRREAESKYRDEHRRQQEEIREERQRVAALERERADKQARDEQERQRMEAAIKALEAQRAQTDASEQEEKRRIKAELDAMRQRMDEMKEASESERSSAERMREEFVCQFCLSALVAPLTLACSHSFCSPCLTDWFHSHDTCISCRQPVNLPPIRALSLDNAIAHLLHGDELDEWRQRRDQWSEEQRAEQRRHRALMDHIEQQRRTNPAALSFMSISTVWSEDEKKLFADGFAPYVRSEECRRAYCALVGLTEEWVLQRARVDELKRACANLRLRGGVEPSSAAVVNGSRSELEKAALQRRFWLLLKLGCRQLS